MLSLAQASGTLRLQSRRGGRGTASARTRRSCFGAGGARRRRGREAEGRTARLPRRSGDGRQRARRRGRERRVRQVALERGRLDAVSAGLLFMAGMRRSEASALRWADVVAAADGDGIQASDEDDPGG